MANLNDEYDFEKQVIICENLVKIYKTKDLEVLALQGLDLVIEKGEIMAIIGNSGSGKSTLLNMIGGLDKPSAGRLYVDGRDLFKLSETEVVQYKRSTVGFVWQNNARNLIPYLNARENICIPMAFNKGKNANERAMELLELVGIGRKAKSKLNQLSGGEQQRVAIAIALANEPKVLLADEPTGSVDVRTSDNILDVFRKINASLGTTIVIVTHDRQLSKKVNRVVAIRDGKTSSEMIMRQSYAEQLNGVSGFISDGQPDAAGSSNAGVSNAGAAGGSEVTHNTQEEFAVLDRVGRLQVPKEYLDSIGLDGNKIKVELVDGKIVLSPPEA